MNGGEAEKEVFDAASRGDVAAFERLVDEDPFLINASFASSRNLLHIATLYGQVDIVAVVLRISLRLARSLDSQKWSPLHIAAAQGSDDIVEKLLDVAPEMCWSRDWQGMNPIHIAAMNGHVTVVEKMVEKNLLPAMERVHRGETVLHLCVKHDRVEALRFLVGELPREFVCAKDDDGDTALHWAARSNQVGMVDCLLKSNKIKELTKNSMGKTAFSILTKIPRDTRDDYLKIKKKMITRFKIGSSFGTIPEISTSIIMVVAALIATMAFQASISPPGGVQPADSLTYRAGEAVMASNHPIIYDYFLHFNAFSFAFAFITIFLLSTELVTDSLGLKVASLITMWISIVCVAGSYTVSLLVMGSKTKKVLIAITGVGVLLIILAIIFAMILVYRFMINRVCEFLARLRQQDDV